MRYSCTHMTTVGVEGLTDTDCAFLSKPTPVTDVDVCPSVCLSPTLTINSYSAEVAAVYQ